LAGHEPSPLSRRDDPVTADRLSSTLEAAVRRLRSTRDLGETLTATVAGAVDAVTNAERAGITQVDSKGVITTQAPTDEQVGAIDRVQSEFAEGPCLDALAREDSVYIADLAGESARWPAFAPRALELGAVSMLSFRLSSDSSPVTALNLYASTPSAFHAEDRLWGEVFASHAAIALAHATNNAGLSTALRSRDLIGQAKGILMERFDITDHEAFTMLVESSQRTNLKLREVAHWLAGHGPQRSSGGRQSGHWQ